MAGEVSKFDELAYELLNDVGCTPGGDGLALVLEVFSDAKFGALLAEQRAHRARLAPVARRPEGGRRVIALGA